MARVLVLRHHDEDRPGLIGEALVERGFELDVVMMNEDAPTPSLARYDALVILGSTSAVYDPEVKAAWFDRELGLIEDAMHRDLPVLGVCFGAQALCVFHGGTVAPSNEPEIGWYEIDVAPGRDFVEGPWFEFHFDRCTLPSDAILLASTPRAVQAFRIGRHVGVQFHPEIDEAQLRDWLDSAADSARDFGHDIEELLAETARVTPSARVRVGELVDLVLEHEAVTQD